MPVLIYKNQEVYDRLDQDMVQIEYLLDYDQEQVELNDYSIVNGIKKTVGKLIYQDGILGLAIVDYMSLLGIQYQSFQIQSKYLRLMVISV